MSPHKNLGGAESTGVLLGRKNAYDCKQTPSFPGGGTVKFVFDAKDNAVSYEDDISVREMAGTPNALGFYRAALSLEI